VNKNERKSSGEELIFSPFNHQHNELPSAGTRKKKQKKNQSIV
jgi:hypothetical protein